MQDGSAPNVMLMSARVTVLITKREGHAECTKFENELHKEELVTYEVSTVGGQ
jgi:hypothetical protein